MTRKVLPAVLFVVLFAAGSSLAVSGEVCVPAATRYHAVQIQSEDVVLNERDVQQFLQSDVFHNTVTDKKFLRADGSRQLVRAALADLQRVRHEVSEYPAPGLWRAELERVFLELDGEPSPCSPCRR